MTPTSPAPTDPAPSIPRPPTGTYRLQLQPGFGFAEAAAVVPYLVSLGVSHLHLSPLLTPAPGSTHGYDVVDHSTVNPEIGGEAGFRALAAAARRHGLGIVVDIVPNHMAVPAPEYLNAQLWDVLRCGPQSEFAGWFDVDWEAGGGKLLMPFLGGPLDEVINDLTVEPATGPEHRTRLRYHEHAFPLRDGTDKLPLRELLDAQHYRLVHWREGDHTLNYRRFFTITTLMGLRQEDPAVFAATHAKILELVREGLVQGLRIDHPDGLADPGGYLHDLREAAGPDVWIVVEKILTGDEEPPADWASDGTTGYDALRRVDGLFTDPGGEQPLTALHHVFTGGYGGRPPDGNSTGSTGLFEELSRASKLEVLADSLVAERARLERVLDRIGVFADDRTAALSELLAGVPVYRPYVTAGQPDAASEAVVGRALRDVPDELRDTAGRIAEAALGLVEGSGEFAVRFAQTSAALVAKGNEDRALYRWHVLSSLNEVGGEPDVFGVSPDAFHTFAQRLAATRPATMTTLSTHDTKRSEDVRARLTVLAELPDQWAQHVRVWDTAAERHQSGGAPDAYDRYLLWQTLFGAWSIEPDRAVDYLLKASREAGRSTSWTRPDADYERALAGFVRGALADPAVSEQVFAFTEQVEPYERCVSLGSKLVQLAMPGVPDVYQGGEVRLRTLVDPDNRLPVDIGMRAALLAQLDDDLSEGGPLNTQTQTEWREPPWLPGVFPLSADKLLVTSRMLRLRRNRPEWFAGAYDPVAAHGPAAAHAVAFQRGGAAGPIVVATRLPVGLELTGGWGATALPLPPGRWRDVLTGRDSYADEVPLDGLLGLEPPDLPVALLVRHGEAGI